jgi:signal transduction histidine kinase
MDGGRGATQCLLHRHSARAVHVQSAGCQQRRALEHAGRGVDVSSCGHTFIKQRGFYLLVVAALVALVVLVQRRRLQRAEGEFRAVLGERNRIAREIHDTLAQGYVGIIRPVGSDGGTLRTNKAEAAAKHLDLTRGYVREGLADARQSIWALRSQDSGENTLPVRLRRTGGGSGRQAGLKPISASTALIGPAG